MKKQPTSDIQHSTSKAAGTGTLGVRGWTLVVGCFLFVFAAVAQQTEVQYLSGHDKDDAVPWEFQCTSGANSGFWTNLPVPSHWDMRGFGSLSYHRDPASAYEEKGLYAKNFLVPKDWSKQRIFLVFEGVMTDTTAKLNGESVGPTHHGSFYRFKYEVTSLVKFGETNRLEVTVAKHSEIPSVNNAERNADYWVFGGIYRPVYLEAVPQQFIERVAIDAKADGSFSANVFLDGVTSPTEVEAQVERLDGKSVGQASRLSLANEREKMLETGATPVLQKENRVALMTRIPSPKTWTAETPNLYLARFRLKQNGKTIHEFTQRFGFRTFEVRDGDGLYLNGRRVILKGADRHSFWPDSGRCLSEKIHRLDIETMKDMNMNAVRMSHYPPDQQFLDLCDELGLYVLDELAGWHRFYDDEIGAKLVHEMIARDVNHPSILFWDNGNEGGFNTNLDNIFPGLDPQHRRVLHPWAAFSGVNTAHYLDYEQAKIACDGKPLYYHPNGKTFADTNDTAKYIYMPTEFQHGLFDGGAGAGLEDYWKLMSTSKYLGGGFIWALTDDAVKRPDTGEMDGAGNQAPDGIVGPYRQREGSFYAIKEIWSPIQVTDVSIDSRVATIQIKNSYAFTDTKSCKFTYEFRNPVGSSTNNDLVGLIGSRQLVKSPSIAPGSRGKIVIDFPMFRTQPTALALQVVDPAGRELWTYVWPMNGFKNLSSDSRVIARAEKFGEDQVGTIELKSKDFVARVNGKTGQLEAVERAGKKISSPDGPRLATTNCVLRNVVWQLRENGWLQCDYTYTATGTNDYFGVLFDYPENLVKHKRWLGGGPYRVWKNRLRGVTLGVWENDYNNTITGYRDWIYPEFKGFFSNVRWMQLDTTEGQITIVNNSGVPFMQVLTPEFPPTNLVARTVLSVPKCGLGFLDAIPAVGSKFKDATFTGPQGQPNVGKGEYSGSVSFYFGKLP